MKKSHPRTVFYLGLGGLITAAPLLAAEPADDTPQAEDAVITLPAESPPATQDAVELAPIVVSGEKMSRRLEDTASSVQVISASDIASSSMDDLYDAYERTANVSMDNAGLGKVGGFVIRGISNNGVTAQNFATNTPLSSVFVDGIPLSIAGALGGPLDLWDVESVEILRGPQSTNQGQSALAGAIHLMTRDPDEFFDARARVRHGNDGLRQYAAALGLPLLGGFSARLTHQQSQSDGEVYNVTREEFGNREDLEHNRIKLGWQSADGESAKVVLSYGRADSYRGQTQISGDPRQRQAVANDPEYVDNVSDVASLRASWLLSDGTRLSAQSGLSTTEQQRLDDYNASAEDDGTIENLSDDETWTHELRVNFAYLSLLGRQLQGVAGVFASHRDGAMDLYIRDGDVLGGQPFSAYVDIQTLVDQTRKGYAAFTEVEWALASRWTLIAGLRYDTESLDFEYFNNADLALTRDGPPLIGDLIGDIIGPVVDLPADGEGQGSADSDAVLPKLGLRFELTPDAIVGITAQRAYRAGGLSVNFVRGTFNTFDPEYTTTGEVFLRLALFDRRVRLRSNLFYTDWQDQQVSVQLSDNANDTQTENAGASKLYGAELEIDARLWRALRGFASLGYTHTEFVEFDSTAGDYSGNEFPSAPRRSAALGLSWDTQGDGLYAQLDANYQDDSFRTADNDPEQTSDARTLVNGRLGWRHNQLDIYLAGRNLLDRFYLEQRAFGLFVAGPARSLMVGIDLSFN